MVFVLVGAGVLLTLLPPPGSDDGAVVTDVQPASPPSVMSSDGSAVEVGLRFRNRFATHVVGVRYYRFRETAGQHRVHLWNSSGGLLAEAPTDDRSSEGWQVQIFDAPVAVPKGATLVVSFTAPQGHTAIQTRRYDRARRLAQYTTEPGAGVVTRPEGFPATAGDDGFGVEPVYPVGPARASISPSPTSTAPTAASTASPAQSGRSTSAHKGTGSGKATGSPAQTEPGATAPVAASAPAGKGCLADPSSCGYPDAGTTGYKHTGVTLTTYKGPMTITKAGTVIDGKLIKGPLVIDAKNVVVKRSKVVFPHKDCNGSCWGVQLVGTSGSRLEDVEVDGNGGACFVGVLVAGSNVARRVDVHDCGDGFRADDGATIVDSYAHDLWRGVVDGVHVDDTHNDGIQTTGHSHQVFRHNTLLNPYYKSPYSGVGVNAVIGIGGEDGAPTDVVIADNLLNGGGFTIRLDDHATNIRITGNRIGRGYEYGAFYTNGGSFIASANVWDNSGATVAMK